MEHAYILADVFTESLFGGNQLAVFLRSGDLTADRMQAIAAELNLSETAFLGAPSESGGSRRLRIFTPKVELPFAGHPTIGTALAMAWGGLLQPRDGEAVVVFEEGAGPVEVQVAWRGGAPKTATLTIAGLPETGQVPAPEQIAAVLGLRPEEIGFSNGTSDFKVGSVSLGVPFTLVPVRDRAVLARTQVDLQAWDKLLARSWAPHLYVFTGDAETAGADIRARMFAPAMGIAEDSATGAAASALAAYLAEAETPRNGTARWVIEQGVEMGRPSRIEIGVQRRDGETRSVQVGGSAVRVGEGRLEVPPSG